MADFSSSIRNLLQDLLRLGMAGAAGYTNRSVARIQLEYITNPYGRQPPHILIFRDGQTEPMTPFQLMVPGYAPDVLAVELLGAPAMPPTSEQLQAIQFLGKTVREILSGQLAFSGNQQLVDLATGAFKAQATATPVSQTPSSSTPTDEEIEEKTSEDAYEDETAAVPTEVEEGWEEFSPESPVKTKNAGAAESPSEASSTAADDDAARFMHHEKLAVAPATPSRPMLPQSSHEEPVAFKIKPPANVNDIFDILGTPAEQRGPLAPGTLFNNFSAGAVNLTQGVRFPYHAPATREVFSLVVVPSHDPFKAEPTEGSFFSIEELRKLDQRAGMADFRGHYLLAKNGDLIPGRSLEAVGNCWPGRNDNAIQIVLAGNGKTPTIDQRRTLYEYGLSMRRHYEMRPTKAVVKDITFGMSVLGIDPQGFMVEKLANPKYIDAPLPAPGKQNTRAG